MPGARAAGHCTLEEAHPCADKPEGAPLSRPHPDQARTEPIMSAPAALRPLTRTITPAAPAPAAGADTVQAHPEAHVPVA